jgi:hypothetical protein
MTLDSSRGHSIRLVLDSITRVHRSSYGSLRLHIGIIDGLGAYFD